MRRRTLLATALMLVAGLLPPCVAAARAEDAVTVFAAASLKAAMGDISDAWAAQGHPKLKVSFESSGTLAKQIEQGAAAHIFISADEKWMDYLARKGLVKADSRRDLLTNTLVLVAPADSTTEVTIGPDMKIDTLLGTKGRLAVGDTATVPAGIYAKQALTRLGKWDAVQPRLAPAANVKAALLLVEKGEAPAGIVYGTDAMGDAKVKVIGTFPESSHDPIVYPICLVAKLGETPQAQAALAFIEGSTGKAAFARYGFGVK